MVGAGRATGAAAFGLRLFPRASQAWLYRATSPEPALSSRLKHLSLQQIPVRSLCEKIFLSQSWSLFFVFSLLGFWRQASSIQQMPVLTGSRCPGGGLDSEFILTVNIHCLCPVPVPVCLLLFSSVPGSTGVFLPELGSKSRKAFLDSGEEFGARISAEVLPSHPAL